MKIKQLVWTQLPDYFEDGSMVPGWHYAKAPSTGKEYNIHLDTDGIFYPLWDCGPGYELLEDAKAEAQADFETKILEALDA